LNRLTESGVDVMIHPGPTFNQFQDNLIDDDKCNQSRPCVYGYLLSASMQCVFEGTSTCKEEEGLGM
jgi:hypothetical protein